MRPPEVVEIYLEVRKNTNSGGIKYGERLKAIQEFIRETRKPIGKNVRGKWLIPNYEIKKIKKPNVYPFEDYQHLSLIKIKAIDLIRNRVYILLNPKKNEILQYFLLNESETKIISFSLLVKDSTEGSFLFFK